MAARAQYMLFDKPNDCQTIVAFGPATPDGYVIKVFWNGIVLYTMDRRAEKYEGDLPKELGDALLRVANPDTGEVIHEETWKS